MRETFKFKLFGARRNRKLHQQINAAGLAYNHCIALHKRYYSLYHKHLNLFHLQKHLTKLKRLPRFAYLKEISSQALQDVAQRIEKGYQLFFLGLWLSSEHGASRHGCPVHPRVGLPLLRCAS